MSGPARVRVTIGRDGSITAHTEGVTGKKCMDYIPALEELLDAEVVSSEFTADYHRSETTDAQQQQQQQWNY